MRVPPVPRPPRRRYRGCKPSIRGYRLRATGYKPVSPAAWPQTLTCVLQFISSALQSIDYVPNRLDLTSFRHFCTILCAIRRLHTYAAKANKRRNKPISASRQPSSANSAVSDAYPPSHPRHSDPATLTSWFQVCPPPGGHTNLRARNPYHDRHHNPAPASRANLRLAGFPISYFTS